MDQKYRRGLLGTLFAGGLLALGCTAANAADSTSGSDGLISGTQIVAPVTAPISLGATSLGVLGDSAATTNNTSGTAGNNAAAPAAGSTTSGSNGILSGTQVVAPVTAPISLSVTSLGVLGESTATTNNTGGTAGNNAAAPAAGSTTSGSDGLLSGTQVVAPVTAPIILGATSVGVLGDSTATTNTGATNGTTETAGNPATPATTTGSTTSGSDGILSGTQVVAPVTAPITVGATSVGVLGDSTATTNNTNETEGNLSAAPAAGSTTTGSDGTVSGTQIVAPVTAPITLGATSVGVLGDSAATTDNGATNGTTGTTGKPATPATTTGSTTSGSDGILSGTQVVGPVSAPITLGAISVGVVGDSTATTNNGATNGTTETTGIPAPAPAASSTSGSDGILSGTQVVAPITAPITLGAISVGVLGGSTATTNTSPTNGTTESAGNPAPAPAASSTSGSDGILSGTQVVAPVTAPITLGATSVGVLGDSTATPNNSNQTEGNLSAAPAAGSTETAGNPSAATAGSSTTGSSGLLSGAQIVAPISKAVSLGAASVAVSGSSTATVVMPMLANTGADTNLLVVAFLFLGAGLLMMLLVARRRKA